MNTNQKLEKLIKTGITSAEMALATGSSLRGIEDRRKRMREGSEPSRVAKLDLRIDALFSIVSLLETHKVEPDNIRAWLVGLSPFLEEQRPALLLSTGEFAMFELVRLAAIAYATNQTPADFLAERGELPRPVAPNC